MMHNISFLLSILQRVIVWFLRFGNFFFQQSTTKYFLYLTRLPFYELNSQASIFCTRNMILPCSLSFVHSVGIYSIIGCSHAAAAWAAAVIFFHQWTSNHNCFWPVRPHLSITWCLWTDFLFSIRPISGLWNILPAIILRVFFANFGCEISSCRHF